MSEILDYLHYLLTDPRMCKRTEEEVDLRLVSHRHRHFVWFFNVPVQAPTRGQPIYTVIPRNRPM